VAACLVAGSAVLALPDHAAAASSDPSPLWQAFPLDETSTGGGAPTVQRAGGRPAARVPSSITAGQLGGGGVPWLVVVLGAAATAVFIAAVIDIRRAGLPARRRTAYLLARRPAAPARPQRRSAAHPRTRGTDERLVRWPGEEAAIARTQPNPPAPDEPAPPTPPEPAARSAGGGRARSARPRGGPVCQVRWLPRGRGMCFCAVIVDEDGVGRTLATSPPVEWRKSGPPDESPEARAALRQLSKTVRESGWRAMRAKGRDFDEQRWYARRFRPGDAPPTGSPSPG
jgi:hypothetical protein